MISAANAAAYVVLILSSYGTVVAPNVQIARIGHHRFCAVVVVMIVVVVIAVVVQHPDERTCSGGTTTTTTNTAHSVRIHNGGVMQIRDAQLQ